MTDIANVPVIPVPAPAPVAPPPPLAPGATLSENDRIERGRAAQLAARAAATAKAAAIAPVPAATLAAVAPVPAPVTPAPATPPPSPAPAAPAPIEPQLTSPQRGAWESIHAAEKKVSEDRAALKKEREEAAAARQAQPAQPPVDLRADPFSALRQAGWDDERLAQALVDRMRGGQPAPVAPPPAPVAPPAQGEPGELEKLREFAGSLADTLLRTRYEIAAQGPDFELIRGEPNYADAAMERAWRHLEQTGQRLTEAQALGMVQDELVAQMQQTLQRQSDPRWQRALKLSGSPAPTAPSGQPTQASPPTAAAPSAPAPTTLTNDLAAPGTLPQPSTGPLSELERHQRAINAMRARRGQQ